MNKITIAQIKNIINYNWEIEEEDNVIMLSTRDHGNVGDESPGLKDIKEATRIKHELVSVYGFDPKKIDISTFDEWVNLEIKQD